MSTEALARQLGPQFGPADHGRDLTYEEFIAGHYEEGHKYELIDGRLYVSPMADYPHDWVRDYIYRVLTLYQARRPSVVERISANARVFVPGKSRITCPEPDFTIYRSCPPGRDVRWEDISPIMVVEIVSADDAGKDYVRNVDLYQKVPSIREYWVFDRYCEVYGPTLRVYHRASAKQKWKTADFGPEDVYTTQLLPGFKLPVCPRKRDPMLRITGGKVYDPANGIDGQIKDIFIDDSGRFAASADGARTIDAAGLIVFPGGVDVHTHVAGGAINFARAMTPEDHRRTQAFMRTKTRRSGLGGMAPTTFATGYLYAGMGFTTLNEAAVPVLSARHTHEELADIPIVDKTSLALMANNEIMLDQLQKGEYERAKQVVAWYLWAAKSYGIKAVNPGGVAAWKWGKDAKQLTSPIEGYSNLTPGDIVTQLAQICDDLGLPHPIHLHCNNLGAPGNITTTLDTLKHLEGRRAHIAHSQYHAYGGDGWDTMCSETAQLAEYFNTHPGITTDAGAVVFGDTVTITADGPWQHLLYKLTGRKWGNLDVENETGCGIVPYTYRPSNLVNAVQWAAGLELLLLIKSPWQVFLSTDHPNGGCFWRYPEIIELLMRADVRREALKKLPDKIKGRITLPEIDREFTLLDVATAMSAGPARALGLTQKGNLSVGSDADVVLYNHDDNVARMFSHPRYVIKGGEIVLEDGEIREAPQGREFLVKPSYDPSTDEFIRPLFEDCYTMSFENYPVEFERIEHPVMRDCIPVGRGN